MAFLNAIKKRKDLQMKGVKKECDPRDPRDVTGQPWVYELDPQRYIKLKGIGKWILHYSDKDILNAWRKIQQLYRTKAIKGISNMKCSTKYNRKVCISYTIIVYCTDVKDKCIEIGHNIAKMMDYKPLSGKMSYKLDAQTCMNRYIYFDSIFPKYTRTFS